MERGVWRRPRVIQLLSFQLAQPDAGRTGSVHALAVAVACVAGSTSRHRATFKLERIRVQGSNLGGAGQSRMSCRWTNPEEEEILVPPEGLAPTRNCLKGSCSATELRRPSPAGRLSLPPVQGGMPCLRGLRSCLKQNIFLAVGHLGIEPSWPSQKRRIYSPPRIHTGLEPQKSFMCLRQRGVNALTCYLGNADCIGQKRATKKPPRFPRVAPEAKDFTV